MSKKSFLVPVSAIVASVVGASQSEASTVVGNELTNPNNFSASEAVKTLDGVAVHTL